MALSRHFYDWQFTGPAFVPHSTFTTTETRFGPAKLQIRSQLVDVAKTGTEKNKINLVPVLELEWKLLVGSKTVCSGTIANHHVGCSQRVDLPRAISIKRD